MKRLWEEIPEAFFVFKDTARPLDHAKAVVCHLVKTLQKFVKNTSFIDIMTKICYGLININEKKREGLS